MSLTGLGAGAGVDSTFRMPKMTAAMLRERKRSGTAITCMTAYDTPTARLVDEAGIDVILVGDSVGNAVLGYADTLPVTMDEMVHHARAVRRGVRSSFVVVDMPYGSYHVSREEAVRNALRFVKDAGAEAVKLEGGRVRAGAVRAIVAAEIPVVGHLGLTPQSVNAMGGYKVQGRSLAAADELMRDAEALERAGVLMLVLEGVPREVAARITATIRVPTIGIGAGPECDGQILVFHDAFGLTFGKPTKFTRRFGDAGEVFREGLAAYRDAVIGGTFPSDAESYHLTAGVREKLEEQAAVKVA